MANALNNIYKVTKEDFTKILAGTFTGHTYDPDAIYLIQDGTYDELPFDCEVTGGGNAVVNVTATAGRLVFTKGTIKGGTDGYYFIKNTDTLPTELQSGIYLYNPDATVPDPMDLYLIMIDTSDGSISILDMGVVDTTELGQSKGYIIKQYGGYETLFSSSSTWGDFIEGLPDAHDTQVLSLIVPEIDSVLGPVYSASYATLKNTKLIPGQLYCINDFVTTTAATNSQSAGWGFKLVLRAINGADFDEKVVSVLLPDNATHREYWTNRKVNLSVWQVWYSFDNDTDRFSWADATNGKGVIYRLIDENNNDFPYDFKNIQFKGIYQTDADTWYYTFSTVNSTAKTTADTSLLQNTSVNIIRNNYMAPYYATTGKMRLSRNIFIGAQIQDNSFYGNTNNCHFLSGSKGNEVRGSMIAYYGLFDTNKVFATGGLNSINNFPFVMCTIRQQITGISSAVAGGTDTSAGFTNCIFDGKVTGVRTGNVENCHFMGDLIYITMEGAGSGTFKNFLVTSSITGPGSSTPQMFKFYSADFIDKNYQITFSITPSGKIVATWVNDLGILSGKFKTSVADVSNTWQDLTTSYVTYEEV